MPTKTIADTAARYHALKSASYLIADTGEVLSAWEYEREVKKLRDELLAYVEEFGPFHVEGIGEFRLQERTTYAYDLKAMRTFRPDLFDALIELDCVKVEASKVRAHSERLSGIKALGIPGGTPALVVEKR